MGISINQIQGLLGTYHRRQLQSHPSADHSFNNSLLTEDKVSISTEARRLKVYQKTTEDILKRLQEAHNEEIKQQLEINPVLELIARIQNDITAGFDQGD